MQIDQQDIFREIEEHINLKDLLNRYQASYEIVPLLTLADQSSDFSQALFALATTDLPKEDRTARSEVKSIATNSSKIPKP